MKPGFLDALDMALSAGTNSLSQSYLSKINRFVADNQMPDGGYRGRSGGSDLYYTDFAVRILSLTSSDAHAFDGIYKWMNGHHLEPQNILECFSILNIRRILLKYDINIAVDEIKIMSVILSQELPNDGFSRTGSKFISAYNTFLAVLCFQMLGCEPPNLDALISALHGLTRPDGGYSESQVDVISQTNATAAAIAPLMMYESLDDRDKESALSYLLKMQSPEGGLLAQPSITESDLLSTYTGMVCIFWLDGLDKMNLSSVAKYVKQLASADGGFRACLSDSESDIEYTYYGLGILALLRVYILAQEIDE